MANRKDQSSTSQLMFSGAICEEIEGENKCSAKRNHVLFTGILTFHRGGCMCIYVGVYIFHGLFLARMGLVIVHFH